MGVTAGHPTPGTAVLGCHGRISRRWWTFDLQNCPTTWTRARPISALTLVPAGSAPEDRDVHPRAEGARFHFREFGDRDTGAVPVLMQRRCERCRLTDLGEIRGAFRLAWQRPCVVGSGSFAYCGAAGPCNGFSAAQNLCQTTAHRTMRCARVLLGAGGAAGPRLPTRRSVPASARLRPRPQRCPSRGLGAAACHDRVQRGIERLTGSLAGHGGLPQ